jgi:hypothetical protein
MRRVRSQLAPELIPHGANGYYNYRCRCEVCCQAGRERQRARQGHPPRTQAENARRRERYQQKAAARRAERAGELAENPPAPVIAKRCWRCGHVKAIADFPRDRSRGDGLDPQCRKCRREQNRAASLRRAEASWRAILDHYGDHCACCGTTEDLTLDHVNGDGRQHRIAVWGSPKVGGEAIRRWVISQGFPATFQLMCRACNRSKGTGPACRLSHASAILR